MLISLNWIKDYVDLPEDVDPYELAERLTVTTAETEGVERVDAQAKNLTVARIVSLEKIPQGKGLTAATVDLGKQGQRQTVTAATGLRKNDKVLYAPVGASVAKLGEIRESTVAGHPSDGMILPGDAVGIALAALEPVFIGPELEPGDSVDPTLFDDWIIEIDNKSLTHRPDLWGHYGIAREIAAIYGAELRDLPVVDRTSLESDQLPEFPIDIKSPQACRRYSGIILEKVPTQPAPLWMQLRLGRTGLRPISGLVDLTNYIMTDIGQPMHAFDAEKVNRIEVDFASDGDKFLTLDGGERKLTEDDLMILSNNRPVAIAGVMGGLETEVSDNTKTLLLESANFDPATIRRTATRLGLRTDASARFEKSLDPENTATSIQRFVHLAHEMYPDMTLVSRISDAFPTPLEKIDVPVNPHHVSRTIGSDIDRERAAAILEPLGFTVNERGGQWTVGVPTFRATNDVSIEADAIEEVARFVGYGNINPDMPRISMRRFEPNHQHRLEKTTMQYFTTARPFHEIFGYLWYDAAWVRQLEVEPGKCVELKNPAAEGLEKFRQSLMPGMLAATARNRFHFNEFSLVEIGSVFPEPEGEHQEWRHLGLVSARRGKKCEENLTNELKSTIEAWAWRTFGVQPTYRPAKPTEHQPWVHPTETAEVYLDNTPIGYVSVVNVALRRKMDEHLAAWGIAWSEIRLDHLADLQAPAEKLSGIPAFPIVEMDFSILVQAENTYTAVAAKLSEFNHPLLKRIAYVDSYEGKSVGSGKRSITFRVVAGNEERTLTESDTDQFRKAFESHLKACGYEIRS